MKKILNPKILPWFTMGAGGLGLVLRSWFYAGIDEKGLLPAKHPSLPMAFILFALVLAVAFLCARQLRPIHKYTRLFPAGLSRAIGCFAGGAGALYAGIYFLRTGGLGIITLILGIAAAGSLVYLGILRKKGSRPPFLLHTLLTVFLMLFTVCNCRIWGSESQIQSYIFPLFACVFLMLTAYHKTVLDVRKGSRLWLVFFSQAALFCCCLSLVGKNRFFYLTMIIYLALDLCTVNKGKPEQPEEA